MTSTRLPLYITGGGLPDEEIMFASDKYVVRQYLATLQYHLDRGDEQRAMTHAASMLAAIASYLGEQYGAQQMAAILRQAIDVADAKVDAAHAGEA